jgi:hypothetical protein
MLHQIYAKEDIEKSSSSTEKKVRKIAVII